MHKVHHSRRPEQTDTNYGNLFSFWDRLFGTFTPSHAGMDVHYGLEGFDQPALQTTAALLAHPFRAARGRPDGVETPLRGGPRAHAARGGRRCHAAGDAQNRYTAPTKMRSLPPSAV
jgi:hypothetical protein